MKKAMSVSSHLLKLRTDSGYEEDGLSRLTAPIHQEGKHSALNPAGVCCD